MTVRAPMVAALIALAGLSACGDDTLPTPTPTPVVCPTATTVVKGADNFCDQVTLTKDANGLQHGDFVVGIGTAAQSGDDLTVNYTGWLSSGKEFDSSRGKQAFSLSLGSGGVIKGWDLGIVGMKVGGKRRLVIPADLAYGNQDKGDIPPNSVLVFDIELLTVNAPAATPAASAAASPSASPAP